MTETFTFTSNVPLNSLSPDDRLRHEFIAMAKRLERAQHEVETLTPWLAAFIDKHRADLIRLGLLA